MGTNCAPLVADLFLFCYERDFFVVTSFVDLLCFCFVLSLCASVYMCFVVTSWLSFVVSAVSLSLSHWYPGSGVVLDCIDS